MKKIISFSVWGARTIFLEGALANAQLAGELLPDWTCRFYHDKSVPQSTIDELDSASNTELVCMPRAEGNYGLFWRFDAWADPNVERFISRDVDCRIGTRETHALREWEESGFPFHMMRDHYLYDYPIMGGLWGAVPSALKINYKLELKNWLNKNKSRAYFNPNGFWWNMDQLFLKEVIWPKVMNKTLIHNSTDIQLGGTQISFKVNNLDGAYIGMPYGKPQRLPNGF